MDRRQAIKRTAFILGYAVSASAISGVLNGCKAEHTLEWTPQFLSNEQAAALKAVTERILPTTDTPGANDVGVHQFIDLLLQECLSEKEKNSISSGLDKMDDDCRTAYGKPYAECDPAQQDELLTRYSQESSRYPQTTGEEAEKPFFFFLRELTLLGYFTSEKVGEEVMIYDPIPDIYQGCIPWEEGKYNWSL